MIFSVNVTQTETHIATHSPHMYFDMLITCCLTVFVSQSSSCPDTGTGSREDSKLPARPTAAAEQTNDEPLGLQAKDKILINREKSYYGQNLYYNNKRYLILHDNVIYKSCTLFGTPKTTNDLKTTTHKNSLGAAQKI